MKTIPGGLIPLQLLLCRQSPSKTTRSIVLLHKLVHIGPMFDSKELQLPNETINHRVHALLLPCKLLREQRLFGYLLEDLIDVQMGVGAVLPLTFASSSPTGEGIGRAPSLNTDEYGFSAIAALILAISNHDYIVVLMQLGNIHDFYCFYLWTSLL